MNVWTRTVWQVIVSINVLIQLGMAYLCVMSSLYNLCSRAYACTPATYTHARMHTRVDFILIVMY